MAPLSSGESITYETIINPKNSFTVPAQNMVFFNNKTIAITGGAGSIGSAVALQIALCSNAQIWLLDNDESRLHTTALGLESIASDRVNYLFVDIRDFHSVVEKFKLINPDLIIHTAALKHVPVLEKQPRDGYLTNVIGLANVIKFLKINSKASLCFVSTDKAANPISTLGKTKLIGEHLVAGLVRNDLTEGIERHHSVVRFGNVFMSRGSVIETFIHQLKNELPITITDLKMQRFFMGIHEASSLICYVILSQIPGVSVFKMGDPVFIAKVASDLANVLGKKDYKIDLIGVKPGEKISEDLFSVIEKKSLNDLGPVWNTKFQQFLLINKVPDTSPVNDLEAVKIIETLLICGEKFE
jgi:FlaA1/EpsC-like NDP-sugar epimerase